MGLPTYGHSAPSLPPKFGITFEDILCKHYGVNPKGNHRQRVELIRQFQFGYINMQEAHPLLEKLRDLRIEIVKRTMLSTMEKILMPLEAQAGGNYLATSYFHRGYETSMIEVAKLSKFNLTMVGNGAEGTTLYGVHKPAKVFIESEKEDLDSVIETSPGWIEVAGYKTSDFKDYGKLTLSKIISLSSNVGMVKLCSNQETEHLTNYYKRFGIGEYPVSILLPAREGFLPHHSEFTFRDKVSSCYGYGMTLSALQIAQAYMVFANNGYFRELRLFKDKLFESNKESQVISQETNKLIIEMLEETVNSDTGTARAARLKGRVVAGKTGTAMESLEEDTSYTATFSGFVPPNNPDYLSVVVLHGLKGEESSGGRVAAPVFSDIMHEIYMLNDLEI